MNIGMKLITPLLLSLVYASPQAASVLGSTVSSFAVLGGVSVTNTGPTALSGNLGVAYNSSPTGITGFYGTLANDGPGTVTGTIHQGDAFAMAASAELASSITSLGLMGTGTTLGADLTGDVLTPGVYTVPAGVTNLTGTLTLNAEGEANAMWVFQMPSSLITSTGSVISVINPGVGDEVDWNVGSSATLGANSTFVGNILANTSITMGNGVSVTGRALALTGDVTMINDTVAIPAVPEPGTYILMMAGLGLIGLTLYRRKGGLKNRARDESYFAAMPAF
jgi:hypothetical protein